MLADKNDKKGLSRRGFLEILWAGSLFGLFGQAGTALYHFFTPRIDAGAFGSRVTAGRVDEFQPGTVSHISKGRFFISRLAEGGVLAIAHRCTHLGCTVPWQEAEGVFHCPCHSSIFTPTGEVISGPAPRPLDIFPIEIVDDNIIVDTGKPIVRQKFEPSQVTNV